jgi:diguanylate cyclase (GGDEF)-like protein
MSASRRISAFVALLWLVAAALWTGILSNVQPLPAPINLPLPVLMLLFFAAERFVLDVEVREQTHSFSLSEIALLLALVFATPADLLVGQTVGAGIALALRPGQSFTKLLFNLANFAVASAVALVVFRLMVGAGSPLEIGGWVGAFAAVFMSDTIAAASVGVVIWLSQHIRPNLSSLFGVGTIYTLVAPSVALLAATVLWYAPTASWLLVVLGLMVWVMLRWNAREVRRHRSVSQLQETTRRIQSSLTLDDVAQELLSTARDMFDAGTAELMLFNAEGTTARRARMADSTTDGTVADDATLEWNDEALDPREGVWARVAAEGRAVQIRDRQSRRASSLNARVREVVMRSLGSADEPVGRLVDYYRGRDIRGAVVAPLRVEDAVVGTLLIGNRHGSVTSWSSADVTLLETLANHAAVAIENSRQADELHRQRDELQRSSTHDGLTGLPNRVLFRERTAAALARGASGAVVLLDLDRFKEINDTLGHQNGDHLLRQVAARLSELERQNVSVARLGGDEYAVLLEDLPEITAATELADQVLARFDAPFVVQGVTMHIETSVGIALFPAHGNDADTLLRRADVAMYQAKATHTRAQVYERQFDPYSEARLALFGELRRAIERAELSIVYQPQATTAGNIHSVEALVRWQHPQRGELPADEFISLAERSELIHPLTRFVLEQAIGQCAAWRRDGLDIRVAVNLSARSLHDGALVDDIAAMLERHDVPASALELEITETSIESDPQGSDALLGRLHQMGVAIAIDDFGTGYSAFSYLQRLPVDEIKIDRSFVMGMESDRRKHQIVRSTVQLGHNLGLRVVAEGVENDAVQELLEELGCDLLQGYHVGRPMSADLVGARLRRAQPARQRTRRVRATG